MRTTLSILTCKMVTFICHIFKKNGSVFPGKIAKKIYKNALDKVKYPRFVVAVTGSSGKGSTVSMVAHILEKNGYKVVWNKSGSNVSNAIVTIVLNNTRTFSHIVDADVLLLECDERYIGSGLKKGAITHLAITNITRDQPSRNIHPKVIYDKIMECVVPGMEIIINVDDPLVNRMKYICEGKVITYGIDKTKYDETPKYSVDFAYCPHCDSKLDYTSYHYGHLGLYKCPSCSFGRGQVDYEATDVDIKKCTFNIGKNKIKLNKGVLFAVYYTLLSYTICKELGLKDEDILREINEDELSSKRGKIYEFDGRKLEMLESKNENNLSYMQSINYIKNQNSKKTVVMGFENVSRRYSFNDLSWLWDIDFTSLNDEDIEKIFLIGRFRYDVAVRLHYDNIDENKIVMVDDLNFLLDDIAKQSSGDIYTMVCFDMTGFITNMLKERSNEKND